MKRLFLIIVLLSVSFLTSFSFQSRKNDDLCYISLAKNFSNLSKIKCSQFIDQFEYIQLETNEKCLIPKEYKAVILRNHILIYSVNFCYLFDRKTGKFLYEIGKRGRGPEEYQNALLTYDYKNSVIYSGGWNANILVFGLNGKYIRSFPITPAKGGLDAPSFVTLYSCLPNSCIAGYYPNLVGIETKLLTITNQKGETIKIFPNRNVYPKQPLKNLDLLDAQFYSMNFNTYFKERSIDTVFEVTEKSMIPHIIFEMGKFSVPYEYKWWLPEERQKVDFILVNNIFENSSWIHLIAEKKSVEYFVLYNKTMQQLIIGKKEEGIPNDIDNFIPFNPEFIDEEGNLAELVDAIKINNWFQKNPSGMSGKVKVLQNVDINQNPILVIGKTKKNSLTN